MIKFLKKYAKYKIPSLKLVQYAAEMFCSENKTPTAFIREAIISKDDDVKLSKLTDNFGNIFFLQMQ